MGCRACGHEVQPVPAQAPDIINEQLIRSQVERADSLDRFKSAVAKLSTVKQDLLIDIGSGSGKFLYLNKDRFADHLGIEVTPECVEFSRALGLKIQDHLGPVRNPSLVTLWHSLEHLSKEAAEKVLGTLNASATQDTRVVISVPNSESWQARIFSTDWAFFDPESHIHQFSPRSLNLLMSKFGFRQERSFYSFIYIFSGYVLSCVNSVTPGHNYFYMAVKRGRPSPYSWAATKALNAFCYFAVLASIGPAFILTLAEKLRPARAAVITASFRKSGQTE